MPLDAWNLSCPDWEARIRTGRSLVPDLPLFESEAKDAVDTFNALRLPDVPGTPLLSEAAGDWFRDIVAALFGSRDPVTNERHIREIFALIGKGNSKTTNGAALMLTALALNTRPRAEYLLIGPTQAIADLAYSQIVGMIELDGELKKRFRVREHVKEIADRVTRAKLKVKTFDLNILTGPRPIGVLLDELHLLGKNPHTAKVLRQIRGGLEKSTEGFFVMITTQSDEAPAGAFRDELMLARSIRDGKFPGRMLPVLYEFPTAIAESEAEWQRADYWPMVMPNLGRSLQLPSLIRDWDQEKSKGAHAIQVWASQHLNIEIGLGLKTQRWRGADHWQRAGRDNITLQALIARCEVITAGVDGGGLDDLLGVAFIGREVETRTWLHWGRTWVHESVLQLRKSEESRFRDFEATGDLVIVEDMEDAFSQVADLIAIVADAGLLAKTGLDPMGVGAIVDALAERDIAGDDRVVAISQGWTLNGAIKTAEIKLASGALLHANQPIMAYAVGNAKVEPRGNAITITKQLAGAGKIDPLMAMLNAVALMSRNPVPIGGRSVYEDHGLMVF